MHRLMAGSTSGWPGLLRLYAGGSPMCQAHRDYVARQLRTLSPAAEVIRRSTSNDGCVIRAAMP